MASSSNSLDASARIQDLQYLYASNANVSNFVSVKLSGDGNYHIWKKQMLCLMKAHDMCGLVDDNKNIMNKYDSLLVEKYDSLLQGWIFGSVTEDVLRIVVDDKSARDVWRKLESCFDDSTMSSKQDSAPTDAVTKSKTKERDVVINDGDMNSAAKEAKGEEAIQFETTETETNYEDTHRLQMREDKVKSLREHILSGNWDGVYSLLKTDPDMIKEKINSDGNTVLHIAVGTSRNNFILRMLFMGVSDEDLEIKNSDGRTVLHIAAIVGNTYAAKLLAADNGMLLRIRDNKGQTPMDKAYENMHLDTLTSLLEAAEKSKTMSSLLPPVDVLVNAISAKQYNLASKLINRNPEYAVSNDKVLMAMARNFPSGLDYGETLIYPRFDSTCKMIIHKTKRLFVISEQYIPAFRNDRIVNVYLFRCIYNFVQTVRLMVRVGARLIVGVPITVVYCIFVLLLMVYFIFFMLYFLLWKLAARFVPAIKNIELKNKEYQEAKKVLELLCKIIIEKRSDSSRDLYIRPIHEAACQDAYEVVDEILGRWPEAIRCTDKNGYDIIQLALIHRSEKVYNLIYVIEERNNVYGTTEDSSRNNMLHLAGRLAPSNKLKRITGAALQLQSELQWFKEVKKLVFPTYVTKENIFKETPDIVFTKEHENLVKEGEQWMKTVAESSSITAALITTIVFAAAITVPGGSNQDTGVPVFDREIAFNIFAISDAISLFFSATALLVFLSILTARFSEQDFLVRLPRRLIIGLCTLLISTTSMMVAFSATLYLVFSHRKRWVLGSICGLAFVPIAFFFILLFPLILDLLRSTYISKFGKGNHENSMFNQNNNIRFFFGK